MVSGDLRPAAVAGAAWFLCAAAALLISPTPYTGSWLVRSSAMAGVIGFLLAGVRRGRRWLFLLPLAYALWLLLGQTARGIGEPVRLVAATAPAWALAVALSWPRGPLAGPQLPPERPGG